MTPDRGEQTNFTSYQLAVELIQKNFNRDLADELYRAAHFLIYGEDGGRKSFLGPGYAGDELPHYIDISPRRSKLGQSNKFLTDNYITASKMAANSPLPLWVDVDHATNALRQAVWRRRFQGVRGIGGGMQASFTSMVQDADALGLGFVAVVPQVNAKSGRTFAHMTHVDPYQVIFDKFARTPHFGSFCAIVWFISVQQAKDMYGEEAIKGAITDKAGNAAYVGRGEGDRQYVRVIDYYDQGIGGSEPTRMVMLGSLKRDKPFYIGPNRHGMLPIASMVNFKPSLCTLPIGSVRMNLGAVALQQQLEGLFLDIAKRSVPIDVFDPAAVQQSQIDRALRDKTYLASMVKSMPKDALPHFRIPGAEIPPALFQLFQYIEQVAMRQSSASYLDYGSPFPGDQSATEIRETADRTDARSQLLERNYLMAIEQAAVAWSNCVRAYDTDPFAAKVELENQRLTAYFNHPDYPAFTLSGDNGIFSQDSDVEIDAMGMSAADTRNKRFADFQMLSQLLQMGLVSPAPGMINPSTFVRKALDLMGIEDTQSWIVAEPAAQGLPPEALASMTEMPV